MQGLSGLAGEVTVGLARHAGEIRELFQEETGDVVLAFRVRVDHAGLVRVDVLPHLFDADAGAGLAEFAVPVAAFAFEAGLDLRFRFPGRKPDLKIYLCSTLGPDLSAGFTLLLLYFSFHLFRDFRMAAAERVDEFLRDSLDLVGHGFRPAVAHGTERPAEFLREQILQQVLLKLAELHGRRQYLPPVQRGPCLVVRAAHAVADDGVLVRLGIAVPGVVMVEHESHDAVTGDAGDPALSGAGRRVFPFEVCNGHFGGALHAFVDPASGVRVGERPEDAHAFGLACGQVPSGYGCLPVVAFGEFEVAEVPAGAGVAAFVDQASHGLRRGGRADLASNEFRGRSDPVSGRVARGRVVVGRAGSGVVSVDGFADVAQCVFGVGEFGDVQCHWIFL